jgi:DNA-binding phage protein
MKRPFRQRQFLRDAGNPRLATLLGVLRAMGLRLFVAAA